MHASYGAVLPNCEIESPMRRALLASLFCLTTACAHAPDWRLTAQVELPAITHDASPLPSDGSNSVNLNRFGFFSDLVFEATSGAWFALSDRGPGGGLIDYATRVQRMRIPFDAASGDIGTPVIEATILLQDADGRAFNGRNPRLLAGRDDRPGLSLDPEGLAIDSRGHLYVADEYGPGIHEFSAQGRLVRSFAMPRNLLPRAADGTPNHVDGRPQVSLGRQDNRGFEGLTLDADGKRLYAAMQGPLLEEGEDNDGRRSRFLRIATFDIRSGQPLAKYAYPLESIEHLNAIDPATHDDFKATQQGRSIGISAIHALGNGEFLVMERDNRGFGIEATPPPLHKRVYRISLQGATDISSLSLAGSNALPAGVVPVRKTDEVDLLALLRAAGARDIPEKLEGLAIGPRLADGRHLVLIGSDNDYSVTQTGSGEQFEVCVNRETGERISDLPLDGACPPGMQRIPGVLLAFAVDFGG